MDRPRIPLRDGLEHRLSKRVALEVPCVVRIEGAEHVGRTRNISYGGLFLSTDAIPAIGTTVGLRFTLPGSMLPVETAGEVRWHRAADQPEEGLVRGIGVRFSDPGPDALEEIRQFLAPRQALPQD